MRNKAMQAYDKLNEVLCDVLLPIVGEKLTGIPRERLIGEEIADNCYWIYTNWNEPDDCPLTYLVFDGDAVEVWNGLAWIVLAKKLEVENV